MFAKGLAFFERYERHFSSAGLLFGFTVDILTFRRVDLLFDNLVITFHILLAGTGIFLINLHQGGVIKWNFMERARPFVHLAVQFAFGNLFSAFFVIYSRSASLAASWPFLLLLLVLLVGNEFVKDRYARFAFQMGVFFLAVFSFSIFLVPVAVGSMGPWVFLLSCAVSAALMSAFVYALSGFVPALVREDRTHVARNVGVLLGLMIILYFTNIIPPIPLSLKEAGVYHSVVRAAGGGYAVEQEVRPWYAFLRGTETLHLRAGEPVYVYAAVFAPTRIDTNIVHHWQYYDEKKGAWVSASRIRYAIAGGRDGGYRGFSQKSSVFPGLWRVDIETTRGQLVGRVKFKIEKVDVRPELEQVVR